MKIRNIQRLMLAAIGITLFAACKKESPNIFNMFDAVTVTYNNSSPQAVTDYKLVNDGEDVIIDYTIASTGEDMYTVVLEKKAGATGGTPDRSTTVVLNDSQRRSYSGKVTLKMQRDGKNTYRVYALNKAGYFIGDGYKEVVVEVNPSYTFLTNRILYLPDTATRVRNAFLSLSDGTTYNYTNGAANSAKIDLGVWRRPNPSTNPSEVTSQPYLYGFYSISTPTNPFPLYDVSSWQKRATKFAAPQNSQSTVFNINATSSSVIEGLAKARNPSLTLFTPTGNSNNLVGDCSISFLTPEGKYGILYIVSITNDLEGRPFMRVHIKIQK